MCIFATNVKEPKGNTIGWHYSDSSVYWTANMTFMMAAAVSELLDVYTRKEFTGKEQANTLNVH